MILVIECENCVGIDRNSNRKMLIVNEIFSLFVNKQVLTNHEIVLSDILDNVKDGTLSINPQTAIRLKQQHTWPN